MNPVEYLKNLFVKKKEVLTEIDKDLLKTQEKYNHLAKALAYERGKRIKAEKNVSDLTKEKDNSEDIARQLSEQKKELLELDVGISTSIKTMLRFAKVSKKSIHIVSYNRERDFGILRDFGINNRGFFSVYIYGVKSPVISGKNLNEIFRNCAGLVNDAKKGIIAINLNSDGEYVENLEQTEVPEILIDFNKKINIMSHDTKPFIERIVEKDLIINEQLSEIRSNEMNISELTKEVNEEKKENEVLRNENDSYKTSLSDTLERFKEVQKNYNNLTKSLAISEEDNSIYENFKEKMDKAIEELHNKLGDAKGSTTIEQSIERIRNIVNWYENVRPRVEYVEVPKVQEKEEKEMPKPIKL